MSKLSADELVLDRRAYAELRPAERDRMIPLRRDRRVHVGDQLACEFENAATLRYQVQEMIYAEGISDPAEAAAEVEAYTRLLPSSHQLCCTLFIELDDANRVRDELDRLAGIQHAVRIEVDGAQVPGVEVLGADEPGPTERAASVHFLRFVFDEEQRDNFRDPSVPASLVIDHPAYAAAVPINGPTRISLIGDLALAQN